MEKSLSTNYKMYKSGKRWITASLITGVVSMGMFAGSQIANADSVSATPVSAAPVSAAPVSEASVSATPVNAASVSATPVSATPVSATPVSATPVSEAPVNEAPVSATPVSATPVSATPVSEAPVNEAPVSATPVSATQSRLKDSSAFTNVTPDNFEDYFTSNGSAKYDKPSGTVTITPDENDKVGSFSLDSKIDMSSSFTLSGSVNLGSHTQQNGGADGIGFAFHNGNTTDLGNAGGNLGIGGLQDAIGFKLDTYHNDYRVPQTSTAGAEIANTDSNGYGWDTDPSKSDYPQFGSFVTTSDQQIKAKDGNNYQRWWATTDTNSAQKLDDADLDGKFHKFVVAYDGDSRTLTINYTQTNGSILTWSKVIPDSYKAMALTVSASTGGNKNLQQFKLDSFEFTQAATVNVKYVDTTGKQIAQGLVNYPNKPAVNGTYSTEQLDIPGYKFVKMDDGSATGNLSISPNGTLTDPGDNGTVVYVYATYTQATQTVNETIHYVDQQGQTVSADHSATPINFVTVTNPVDQSTKTYVSTTASSATLDDNGVPTGNDWQEATNGKFSAVMNPTIAGYHVISTTDPANDLTTTTEQTVNGNSQDLEFTVVYAPNE
ncbi:MucBP domain-containing protein, partial [Leuconostoc gelidum subsp. gasicomitatum]